MLTPTPYVPSASFLAWIKQRRPRAFAYVCGAGPVLLHGAASDVRRMLTFPGAVIAPEDAIDFDRHIDGSLCLVLDGHPDTRTV